MLRRPDSLSDVNDAEPTEHPGTPAPEPAPKGSRRRPEHPPVGPGNPSPDPLGSGDGKSAAAAAPREASAKTAKSEQTRALILETAMRLFQERGYDKTTMRAIAAEAGVSVGNAYYYFDGKDLRSFSSNDFASSRAGSVGECGRRDI